MMGIKERTCHVECWVMHGSVQSLYCTPETNLTLYVDYTRIKIIKLNKKHIWVLLKDY